MKFFITIADVDGYREEETISMMEGVGNEVIVCLASFLAVFIPIAIAVIFRRPNYPRIHPDEVHNVQSTSETIGNSVEPDESSSPTDENDELNPPRNLNAGEPCPICLSASRYLVVTNCGHGFCGQCLTTYWQTRFRFSALICPVCRQQVNMLFISFNEAEITEESTNIQNLVRQYNRRFSSRPRTVMEYIYDLPILLQQLFYEFFNGSGLAFFLRFRIIFCFIAAILYFVSPFDFLSEAAFGLLGFVDDLIIALIALFYVSNVYRNIVADR